jgi:hypothetical protein
MKPLSKSINVTCFLSLHCKSRRCFHMILITLLFISGIVMTSCSKPAHDTAPVLHRLFLVTYKPETTKAQIDEILQLFYGLKEKVPGMLDVVFANVENFNGEPQYTHVLMLSFSSEEAMKTYEGHPDHKTIIEIAPQIVETRIMMDYWTGRD